MTNIPDDYVKHTCKPGTHDCCSYLCMGGGGWECGKLVPGIKPQIDARRAAGTMNAKGDNCPGYGIVDSVLQ